MISKKTNLINYLKGLLEMEPITLVSVDEKELQVNIDIYKYLDGIKSMIYDTEGIIDLEDRKIKLLYSYNELKQIIKFYKHKNNNIEDNNELDISFSNYWIVKNKNILKAIVDCANFLIADEILKKIADYISKSEYGIQEILEFNFDFVEEYILKEKPIENLYHFIDFIGIQPSNSIYERLYKIILKREIINFNLSDIKTALGIYAFIKKIFDYSMPSLNDEDEINFKSVLLLDLKNSINDFDINKQDYNMEICKMLKFRKISGEQESDECYLDNFVYDTGFSSIFYSIFFEDEKMIQFLIWIGADINILTTNGSTPLHFAAYRKSNMMGYLQGADSSIVNNDGHTILHSLIYGIKDIISERPKKKKLNYAQQYLGVPPKLISIIKNIFNIDVNARDNYGNTALHLASWTSSYQGFSHLLSIGSDINIVDNYGRNVLHIAAIYNQDCVPTWIKDEYQISYDKQDNNGNTALHWAFQNADNISIINRILSLGCSFNIYNNDGFLPFHCIILNDQTHICFLRILDGLNKDINMTTRDGKTLLHLIGQEGYIHTRETCEYLVYVKEMNVNALDNYNNTPLHTTFSTESDNWGNNTDFINTLLNTNKCNFNIKNNLGNTILHILLQCIIDEYGDCLGYDDISIILGYFDFDMIAQNTNTNSINQAGKCCKDLMEEIRQKDSRILTFDRYL